MAVGFTINESQLIKDKVLLTNQNIQFNMDGLTEDYLWHLSKNKLAELISTASRVRQHKYLRLKKPKYRTPGYKCMKQEDIITFFNSFKPEEYRFKVMFAVQAFLGLRIGEVVKLRINDLDFRAKQVKVRTEKKKEAFEVIDSMFMHHKLECLLMDYLSIYEQDIIKHDNYLFFDNTNHSKFNHTSPSYSRKIFREICNRAGLTETYGEREKRSEKVCSKSQSGHLYKYSTHSLRYAFAKYLIRNHVPLELCKVLLRHDSIKSTEIYAVPDKEQADGVMEKLFTN